MTSPVDDLKHELLAAAERRQAGTAPAERRRLRTPRVRRRTLLAVAALGIPAAAALLLLFPTGTAPNVIESAQAARLVPPRGTIAHWKWEDTMTSARFGCAITRRPNELWFDLRAPRRYRLVLTQPFPDPRSSFDYHEYVRNLDLRQLACARGRTLEIGGSLDPGAEETLVFARPNRLVFMPWFSNITFPSDPAARLRAAIRAGRARDEGETILRGRTVVRIRIDPPPRAMCPDCPQEPAYVYVDPDTFYPVEERFPGAGIPLPDRRVVRVDIVRRYSVFEYLPRTRRNLALTSIKAQHPGWTR